MLSGNLVVSSFLGAREIKSRDTGYAHLDQPIFGVLIWAMLIFGWKKTRHSSAMAASGKKESEEWQQKLQEVMAVILKRKSKGGKSRRSKGDRCDRYWASPKVDPTYRSGVKKPLPPTRPRSVRGPPVDYAKLAGEGEEEEEEE